MFKFKFGRAKSVEIKVVETPPSVGSTYHHKDRDPHDMVSHVVVREVEEDCVTYRKFYKSVYPQLKHEQMDGCSVAEFNKWFREGE